jgi:hypothetical protein
MPQAMDRKICPCKILAIKSTKECNGRYSHNWNNIKKHYWGINYV